MIVERDIAAFAFPFAAATAAALWYSGLSSHPTAVPAVVSFLACSILLSGLVFIVSSGSHGLNSFNTDKSGGYRLMILIMATAACTGLTCGFSGVLLSISECEGSLMKIAGRFGESMQEAIDSIEFRKEQTGALVKALLTGNRTSLTSETIQVFRNSGASHILALSGLHLGIIYGIMKKILSLAGGSRSVRILGSILCIAICGFYTLSTGAGDSITRAFIFIVTGETASLLMRTRRLSRILMTGLIIHLALMPRSISSISFQLSYAAMAGIAWLYPSIRDLWVMSPAEKKYGAGILNKIWDMAALSISCQASAGIVAWFYFGTFPQYFLLTNLLAAPIAVVLIPSALLCLTFSALFGTCPHIFLTITEFLASAMTFILEIIAGL